MMMIVSVALPDRGKKEVFQQMVVDKYRRPLF